MEKQPFASNEKAANPPEASEWEVDPVCGMDVDTDRLAKIGSSNLSNRSMGLDTECDLAIEASDSRTRDLVASVRNGLLAEHLGISKFSIRQQLESHGSLCWLVDAHPKDRPRRLVLTPKVADAPLDLAVLGGAVVNPPEPWSAKLILEHAVPLPLRRRLSRRWSRPLFIVALAIAAWLAFRHWAGGTGHLGLLVGKTLTGIADRPAGTLLVTLFYALAGALFVPVTLLATTTLAVFGLWPGVGIAWSGSLLGAMLSHAVGNRLGPRVVAWLPSRVEKSARRFLERQSFWSVVFMRIVPLGNFGALNLAAGALGVKRRSFILGNMVGLLPGLFGLGAVVSRTLALLYKPTAWNVVAFALVAGVMVAATLWVRRRYKPGRRSQSRRESGPSLISNPRPDDALGGEGGGPRSVGAAQRAPCGVGGHGPLEESPRAFGRHPPGTAAQRAPGAGGATALVVGQIAARRRADPARRHE
jgi:phospholipase D1/2